MATEIKVPALGESVTEATVAKWLKKLGEPVAVDDPVVELEELVFPDEIHDFLMHAHWLRAYHAAAEFLDRHLRR